MIVDSKEALALMDKIEKGVPKFCNPVPSRADWEKLRKLLNTPPTPQLVGNFGHIAGKD